MLILLFLVSLITVLYLLIILIFTYGWYKTATVFHDGCQPSTPVSVIVPFRNEEARLPDIFQSLTCQNYPKELTEILFINDQSEDNSSLVLMQLIKNTTDRNIKLIDVTASNGTSSKKTAIAQGISHCNGTLILTTDADCFAGNGWISSVVNFYEKHHPKMITSPVAFTEEKSFFTRMQSLEFMSLIASGAGSVEAGFPVMCNGANLAFEKAAYDAVRNTSNSFTTVSGDDIFLLLNIKKKFGSHSIRFLKNPASIIHTHAKSGFLSFINQRIRWVSKSKKYRDSNIIFVSLIIFLFNLLLASSLIASIFNYTILFLFFTLLCIKTITDFPLLYGIAGMLEKKKLLIFVVPLEFIYPFYIVLTAISGQFSKFRWKNRDY